MLFTYYTRIAFAGLDCDVNAAVKALTKAGFSVERKPLRWAFRQSIQNSRCHGAPLADEFLLVVRCFDDPNHPIRGKAARYESARTNRLSEAAYRKVENIVTPFGGLLLMGFSCGKPF
jgi:hypothetical protein